MRTDEQITAEVDYLISINLVKVENRATEIQKSINREAQTYLKHTDWYVIRFLETGVAVPNEVTTQRAAARLRVV